MKIFMSLLLIGVVVIQFFPAKRNQGNVDPNQQIQHLYDVPEEVQAILKGACLDCHSNTTTYPWYTHVQPIGWWLANHVKEGKRHLNFDAFGSYDLKRQAHKLEEVVEMVEKKAMPLKPYPSLHEAARLSDAQRQSLMDWASAVQEEITQNVLD